MEVLCCIALIPRRAARSRPMDSSRPTSAKPPSRRGIGGDVTRLASSADHGSECVAIGLVDWRGESAVGPTSIWSPVTGRRPRCWCGRASVRWRPGGACLLRQSFAALNVSAPWVCDPATSAAPRSPDARDTVTAAVARPVPASATRIAAAAVAARPRTPHPGSPCAAEDLPVLSLTRPRRGGRLLVGVDDRLHPVAEVELRQDPRDVGLGGPWGWASAHPCPRPVSSSA